MMKSVIEQIEWEVLQKMSNLRGESKDILQENIEQIETAVSGSVL